jgi:hypothetical protein
MSTVTDDDRRVINKYPMCVKLSMAKLWLLRHPKWGKQIAASLYNKFPPANRQDPEAA